MKRILIFSLVYYPKYSGAEIAVKEITDRIKDIEFHMVTMRFDPHLSRTEKIGNIYVHRIGFANTSRLNKLLFQFMAGVTALSLHRKYRFDAVWAVMAHSSGVPAAIFKLTHTKTPYILTLQEGDPPEYVERVMRPLWPLFSRAFTKADIVQAISTFLGTWARRRGFTGPLEIIPNGASDAAQTYTQKELSELKKRVGKKEGDVLLLSIGRLVHQKAIDEIIRALTRLPQRIHFLAVGDGPERGMLELLAQELGVEKRVKFTGHVDRSETAKYRAIADIFVLPSRSEGMGISLVSAMASGLPVISTQEGGIADFLFDAKRNPDKETTGWAVDKDDSEQIARSVEDILAHPEQAKKVTETARHLVSQKYNWDVIAKDMRERVFQRVL